MTDLVELFGFLKAAPELVAEVQIEIEQDNDDFHAELLLNRLFTLRLGVAEVFGQAAMYSHAFYETPIIEHDMKTPHRMACEDVEGLRKALVVLDTMRPIRT